MPGVLRPRPRFSDAELAIARERTAARLADLFGRGDESGERPGRPGRRRPPILVEGDTELIGVRAEPAGEAIVGTAGTTAKAELVGVMESPSDAPELVSIVAPTSVGELVGVMAPIDEPVPVPGMVAAEDLETELARFLVGPETEEEIDGSLAVTLLTRGSSKGARPSNGAEAAEAGGDPAATPAVDPPALPAELVARRPGPAAAADAIGIPPPRGVALASQRGSAARARHAPSKARPPKARRGSPKAATPTPHAKVPVTTTRKAAATPTTKGPTREATAPPKPTAKAPRRKAEATPTTKAPRRKAEARPKVTRKATAPPKLTATVPLTAAPDAAVTAAAKPMPTATVPLTPAPDAAVTAPLPTTAGPAPSTTVPRGATRKAAPPRAPAPGVPGALCPYCALLLDPPPGSNRRCPRCRLPIVVKRVDGRVAYLTEAAVAVFDAERRKMADTGRLAKEREKWLKLAAGAGAPAQKASRLAVAHASGDTVAAARQLYLGTVDRAFVEAKRAHRWGEASRIRREQAIALHRLAGSPQPPPGDLVALYREGVAAELRGLTEIVRDAELVSATCCDACRADDGQIVAISKELRVPRLPHEGCPRVFCHCSWDLATRDRETVLRYLRRRPRPSAKS